MQHIYLEIGSLCLVHIPENLPLRRNEFHELKEIAKAEYDDLMFV